MPPRPQRATRDGAAKERPSSGRPSGPIPVDGGTDRKKHILKAAVKVFAERGYHGCRISDVADEAGVAYGLVYHYYGNKDRLLASIFDTNWAFFSKAVEDIGASNASTREKIIQVVDFVFGAYELAPLVVKVLILEFGRNARLGEALDHPTVGRVFETITRLFREAAQRGELAKDVDPAALTMIFVGAMETALASLVLSPRAGGKNAHRPSLEVMKKTMVTTLLGGALTKKSGRA